MNENAKLARVKKMTKITAVILKIAEICLTVGAGILLTVGLTMCLGNKTIEKSVGADGDGSWEVKSGTGVVEFSVVEIEDDKLMGSIIHNSKSDLPFIQNMIDEGDVTGLYGLMNGAYAIGLAIVAVGAHFLRLIFVKINKADNPFTPEVLKQMKVSFIVLSVGIVTTAGSLLGVFTVLGLWCIYCIFSYGCSIQELADETI